MREKFEVARRRGGPWLDWGIRIDWLRGLADDWLPWAIASFYKPASAMMGVWAGFGWSSVPLGFTIALATYVAGFLVRSQQSKEANRESPLPEVAMGSQTDLAAPVVAPNASTVR